MKSPIRSVLTHFAVALSIAATVACGGIKATLVASHAAIEQGYNAADNGELRLCYGTSDIDAFTQAQLTHCTQGTPGLTDARHLQITGLLKQAYAAQQRAGDDLKTWNTGDPVPTSLTSELSFAQQVKGLAVAIDPSATQNKWVADIQSWITSIQDLVTKLGGK